MTSDALPQEIVEALLRDCRTIAVVGLSSNPARPSYRVAAYMQQQGKVNIPTWHRAILGSGHTDSVHFLVHPFAAWNSDGTL